jgi:HAD superfamily hydrolase (TIGR01490 family)
MDKSIAFFDFDGTITTDDTMFAFLRYLKGNWVYYPYLLTLTPVFIALKLGILSNHRAKEIMLTRFIGGMKEQDLINACHHFSQNILPGIIRPAALTRIREHQQEGTEVVVVSAAPTYWVTEWCSQYQIRLIATQLEVKNGSMTGCINGKNCHGAEKVQRIREAFDLSTYSTIYAYGDTEGDRPMLALAHHAQYKPFR